MGKTRPLQSMLDLLPGIGPLTRALRLPPVSWGAIIFAFYYLLPGILCGFEGVLIGVPSPGSPADPPINRFISAVSRQAIAMPFLKDLTHLMMAIVVSIGGTLCIIALSEAVRVYDSVSDPHILKADTQALAFEREHMEKSVRSRIAPLFFLIVGASCGWALWYNGCSVTRWWGNPRYGPAGAVLACGVALVIFYGMHALYILAVAGRSVGRLVSQGVYLRPFHPDGCNGFSKLGNLLLLLLLVCVGCVTASWITIHHGYLGIQEFPGIWLAAVAIVVFVPFIVIQPLINVSTQIRRAQLLRLAPMESTLNTLLQRTEERLQGTEIPSAENYSAQFDELKNLRDVHQTAKDIFETSVFPFNRKVASVLSLGYIAQAVALATEIVGKFR